MRRDKAFFPEKQQFSVRKKCFFHKKTNHFYNYRMAEFSDNSSLEQFELLQKSGMLGSLEQLQKENKQLQRTIKDMSVLVTYSDAKSMMNFIISKFLDYLVPETLVFMIRQPRSNEITQYYYRKLTKEDSFLSNDLFYLFKDYFDANPNYYLSGEAVSFEKLSDNFAENTFSQEFLSIGPKYIIPLIGLDGTYGIVIFGNKITGHQYDTTELFYIQNMFAVFAVSLQNEINYKTSITDPKTGLYTYDYFINRIQEKIAFVRRYNAHPAVLMLDIDHFKNFNDTYGHLAGDKVLAALAKTLRHSVREEDCVARFGGEEFVILLSECNPPSLFSVAERIRKEVEKMEVFEKDVRLRVTISIGGSFIKPDKSETPKTIIKRTDDALYQSKENGRNRCTLL